MTARPLLLLAMAAACLAAASGQGIGIHETAGVDVAELDRKDHIIEVLANTPAAFVLDKVLSRSKRRLNIDTNPSDGTATAEQEAVFNQSTGALLLNDGSGGKYTMTAGSCYSACEQLRIEQPGKYRHHNWAMGPVRNQIERDHIAAAINVVWAYARPALPVFWPVNTPAFGAPGQFATFDDAKYHREYAIWIGLFGDAGQTNQSCPFYGTDFDNYVKEFVKFVDATTDFDYGQIESVRYKPQVGAPQFPWSPATKYVQSAEDFYEWLPFQTMPLDFSWRDWAPSHPQVGSSARKDNRPFACTRMVAKNWDNQLSVHGQQESAPCADKLAMGCFCRALCSVADSEACLARRRCSIDGTIIEDNYEYDYTTCTCNKVDQVRCCSDCHVQRTGGRIKPTECRGIVPGDKDYADAEPMLEEFKDQDLKAVLAPLGGEERGFKACRRILWGPQKTPIKIGDATNTLAPDEVGIGQDRRRMNLPEF